MAVITSGIVGKVPRMRFCQGMALRKFARATDRFQKGHQEEGRGLAGKAGTDLVHRHALETGGRPWLIW